MFLYFFDQWTETILVPTSWLWLSILTPTSKTFQGHYIYICLSCLILIQAYEAIYFEKVTHEVRQK